MISLIRKRFLLEGEHTRVKTVVTSSIGGLTKFTKKLATCIGCKSVLPKDGRSLFDITLFNTNISFMIVVKFR